MKKTARKADLSKNQSQGPARGQTTTLDDALRLFETIGMPARNLSARTRKEYRTDLQDLVAFLAQRDIENINNVSLADLERYQAEMDRRGFKASTRERKTYLFLKRNG